jgi:hypothetical protein
MPIWHAIPAPAPTIGIVASGALPWFESYADHDRITRIVLRRNG